MKKRSFILFVSLLLITFTITGTIAFLTDAVYSSSVVKAGNLVVQLSDMTIDNNGVAHPTAEPLFIIPGSTVEKSAAVQNLGDTDIWVRLKPEARITNSTDTELPLESIDGSGNSVPNITINFTDQAKWIKGSDGYWYYTDFIAPNEYTGDVFYSVDFALSLKDEMYLNSKILVDLNAQAVQKDNNQLTVFDAIGWTGN